MPNTDSTLSKLRYFDLKKHWTKKVLPHLKNEKLIAVLVEDLDKLAFSRWSKHFTADMVPAQFDSCDWRFNHRGKQPRFWAYASHGKCHWLVNFNLELAKLVMPDRPWRIRTSQAHSTVWDGGNLLFDINFLALGVPPDECFKLASGRSLKIGQRRVTYPLQHWTLDTRGGK